MDTIKEVIRGKIDILNLLENNYIISIPQSSNNLLDLRELLDKLQQELQSAKSIKDIEREAFEAGREYHLHNTYKYDTFENYLKEK